MRINGPNCWIEFAEQAGANSAMLKDGTESGGHHLRIQQSKTPIRSNGYAKGRAIQEAAKANWAVAAGGGGGSSEAAAAPAGGAPVMTLCASSTKFCMPRIRFCPASSRVLRRISGLVGRKFDGEYISSS